VTVLRTRGLPDDLAAPDADLREQAHHDLGALGGRGLRRPTDSSLVMPAPVDQVSRRFADFPGSGYFSM
jgi:hypothetical protein